MDAAGFAVFPTTIGSCGIAWEGDVIVGAQLPEEDEPRTRSRVRRRFPELAEASPPAWVARVIERVQALLDGARDDLMDVPLAMDRVPEFNRRVYVIARAIAPGRTRTYGDIAKELGDAHASRAVGQALGHNPFAPIVPCHRVLAANNAGGGFSATGGVATKLRMLQIEHAQLGEQRGLFDERPSLGSG